MRYMTHILIFLHVLVFAGMLLAAPAWAGQITATWEYPYEVSDLQGFKLYHEGNQVADITDPSARQWQGEVPNLSDGENNFSLTAYDTAQESEPATTTHNPAPPGPDGFVINVTVNVTVNGAQ